MRFRRFFYNSVLLVAFFSLAGGLSAASVKAANDVYTVKNISIDAIAGSVTEAKAIALRQGYKKAFQALVQKLVPQSDHAKLPALTSQDALGYILDISLSAERSSAVRYIANMTVRFKKSQTRSLLRNSGVAISETTSKPVLILSIQKQPEDLLLWEDENLWRMTWEGLGTKNGLVPLIVPLGDLEDITMVDAEGALAGQDGLWSLASKYGSNDVFLSIAEVTNEGTAANISAVRVGRFGEGRSYQLNVTKSEDETSVEMLRRAATSLNNFLQQDWKQANLLQFGIERRIFVEVPISGLKDWVSVNNRLQGVPAINRVSTRSINRSQVLLDVYFSGNERQLSLALAQKDLALLLNENSIWELRILNKPQARVRETLSSQDEALPVSQEPVVDEVSVPAQKINLDDTPNTPPVE